ncbi:hypothetical protein FGB62_94g031 [Gracilaria domingensis]|nr:hypothetical protein FGB62_94g031 [Gracilaria domingensis]
MRALVRAFHSSRVTRGGGGGGGLGPFAETEVNEPGGRLFGEAIRKPGERRKLFDWEVPYLGTLFLAGILLGVGLNSRPSMSADEWAKAEAKARMAARGEL